MSFTTIDQGGCKFNVDAPGKSDRVVVTVGQAKYIFSAQDARNLAAALEYHGMLADETGRWV